MVNKLYLDELLEYIREIKAGNIDLSNLLNAYRKLLIFTKPEYFRAYTYFCNLLDYHSLPQIVPKEHYRKVKNPTIYRGMEEFDYNASILCDFDYHYGDGQYGHGIYATDSEHYACECTSNLKHDHKKVMKFRLADDTKIVHFQTIVKMARGIELYIKKREDKNKLIEHFGEPMRELIEIYDGYDDKENLSEFVLTKPTMLSMLLGYDVMWENGYGHNNKIYAINNRGKIVVSEKEFNRICDASTLYKGGKVSEEKYNQMLNE